MMRLLAALACLWCLGSAYLIVHFRQAPELRAAAAQTRSWDSRKSRSRHPTQAELAQLPELPRSMVRSQCENEGGDTLGLHNCYAEAAGWMISTAREHETGRMLGYSSLGLLAPALGIGFIVYRRQRRSDAAMAEARS